MVAWKNAVLDEREGVVTESPQRGRPREESKDAIFRPADFALELVEVEGLGVEERGRRATRDVVAEEVEDMDEDGETKRDAKGADAVCLPTVLAGHVLDLVVVKVVIGVQGNVC